VSVRQLLSRRPNPVTVQPGLAASPAEKLAVVTCMDARIEALGMLGLRLGDAHIIRNAGAVVTDDVLRSLAISQRKLGTRNVVLVAHTGCGLLSFTDDELVAELAEATGQPPTWRPGTFRDPIQHVQHGMRQVKTSPFLHPDTEVYGFVFDLKTGTVDEVPAASEPAEATEPSGVRAG
jgi:carbonic anhydrase